MRAGVGEEGTCATCCGGETGDCEDGVAAGTISMATDPGLKSAPGFAIAKITFCIPPKMPAKNPTAAETAAAGFVATAASCAPVFCTRCTAPPSTNDWSESCSEAKESDAKYVIERSTVANVPNVSMIASVSATILCKISVTGVTTYAGTCALCSAA